MKPLLLVANWKMHKTKQEVKTYLKTLLSNSSFGAHQIVLAPSFTLLDAINCELKHKKNEQKNIKLAGQNMYSMLQGAYTGEVSATMLKDVGAEYVLLGHSERRFYFLETDPFINKKVLLSLKENLTPIICVGESKEQRQLGVSKDLVKEQVLQALNGVVKQDLYKIVFAYEPIWAIGTGLSASPKEAEEMAEFIVKLVQEQYKTEFQVMVLYGGSVNEKNAHEFFACEHISGALVGGASLDADKFKKIIGS
jgi:triosephosphate isomerase